MIPRSRQSPEGSPSPSRRAGAGEAQKIGDRGRATLRIPASRVITRHPVAILTDLDRRGPARGAPAPATAGVSSIWPTPAVAGGGRGVGTLAFPDRRLSWAGHKSDPAPPRVARSIAMPAA